jgi:ADP-ribosylglycohydrolase/fructose-1,6-bisphosphatase/inositol monophosphatase family enzyme
MTLSMDPDGMEFVPGRYREEWAAAVEIAREAGMALRREAYRSGGPRGNGARAVVDEQVEATIRKALRDRFPRDRFLGEESGIRETAERCSGRIWVVDPNDGTKEFIRGYRGSSVSIALVEGGFPVLGVVYAYRAPDDEGDLIGAVEGGPLLRGGRPVRRDWNVPVGPDALVLVAPEGDRKLRAYIRVLAPVRYRTCPGLAYRLALTAAGEADAATALSVPAPWDVAAGQALLRAAGGDLFDESGVPVRYDEQGYFRVPSRVFGGGGPLIDFLRSRGWGIPSMAERDPGADVLCCPLPGRGERDPGRLSRAQGCWLGQLAGDALGAQAEFLSASEIRSAHPGGVREMADGGARGALAGQPTDDSEMALALARSLLGNGGFDAEAALRAYGEWLRSEPSDVGDTVRGALTGHPNRESQANGALMRIAPLGLLGAGLPPERRIEWARADGALTHPHPICLQANALFARGIAWAVAEAPSPEELYAFLLKEVRPGGCAPDLEGTLREASRPVQPEPEEDVHAGWVLVALRNALWQLLHAPSLEEALVDTVGRGGDTDTNGAVCGALLGAVRGREAVPTRWTRKILSCRPLAGAPEVLRPRPIRYWPVDALILAENLLRDHRAWRTGSVEGA